MSGSTIGGVIGAIIGGIVTESPQGAMAGYAIGSGVGGLLFPQKIDGPRLTDLKVQSSEYGRPIPIVYGTVALGGNVIWASDYVEEKSDSGGKGGPSVSTYSYYGNFAIAFCEGEASIGRMWGGPEKRLIWDGVKLEGGGKVRFYTGSEDQLPDPLIESYLGVGNVPAYRGTCYAVFEHFPLEKDGNTLPFITAEIGNVAAHCPVPVLQPNGLYMTDPAPEFVAQDPDAQQIFYDDATQKLYWMSQGPTGLVLRRYDPETKQLDPVAVTLAPTGTVQIAWDGQGTAQYIVGDSHYYMVSLNDWGRVPVEFEKREKFTELDGYETDAPIALTSIAYGGGQYRYLSWENSIYTCSIRGAFPCGVHAIVANEDLLFGSYGVRFGGYLTSMGEDGIAVSFVSQPSSFAPKPIEWSVYSTGPTRALFCLRYGFWAFAGPGVPYTEVPSSQLSSISAPVYDPFNDRIFAWENVFGLVGLDPARLVVSDWQHDDCIYYDNRKAQSYADGTPVVIGGDVSLAVMPRGRIAVASKGGGDIFIVKPKVTVSASGVPLSEVVADLSDRARESRYNVSQLSSDIVDGYVIARQTTARNAIDALRPAYYFDAVESGGVVKYVKRGGAPVATIDADDLDARGEGQASGDPLLTTRQMEVELPRVVNVNYMLAATDYSPATKLAKRLVGASGSETTLDLPLVLTDTKAQEIADVNLQLSWVQRLTYAFSLPRKYSDLEPTDHIVIKGNGMRLTKVTRAPGGVLKCEAVADGSTFYRSNSLTTETPPNDQTVYSPGTTTLELM